MILWRQQPGRVLHTRLRRFEHRIWSGPVPLWYLDRIVPVEEWLHRKCVHVWLELHLEPRDLWVGVFHNRPDVGWRWARDFWICPLPMLALKVMARRS